MGETDNFADQLEEQVLLRANEAGILAEEAFFDVASDLLIDSGEFAEANYARYRGHGVQVDGYGGSLEDESSVFKLILLDYVSWDQVGTSLTTSEVTQMLRRGCTFIKQCSDNRFAGQLEESSPVFALAKQLSRDWDRIGKIRVVVISNRTLGRRFSLPTVPVTLNMDIAVELRMWDLQRMAEVWGQGLEREPIVVDFDKLGVDIPALSVSSQESSFDSYLMVLPGETLAEIYNMYGTQLLEQNVRVYLQARGKVNQGIQNTILDEPEMFFSYNNGLTATAESVEIAHVDGALKICKLINLQIVNGGQTMASIYRLSTYCKKLWKRGLTPDLSSVAVQMKLSIVPAEKAPTVVPKISRFANSQNKVSDADFFSNHPFHVEFERLSQRISANPVGSSFIRTHWFYERMRGQFMNANTSLTGRELTTFKQVNPRSQIITKTSLAKTLMPWLGKPELAQRGAAKCFNAFAEFISKEWDKDQSFCNEYFFKESVAKAILFKSAERVVNQQSWYQGGGTRGPIVIHTLGKLAFDLKTKKKMMPFLSIWNDQELTRDELDVLAMVSTSIKDVVLLPPREGELPTEWAKKEACTKAVESVQIAYPSWFISGLVDVDAAWGDERSARREKKLNSDVDFELFVVNKTASYWTSVLDWARSHNEVNDRTEGLLTVATKLDTKFPTGSQLRAIYRIHEDLVGAGLPDFVGGD